jgi:GAF domain-containing protein
MKLRAAVKLTWRPACRHRLSNTICYRLPKLPVASAVQIADVLADTEYTQTEQQKLAQFRTLFGVPLLREGEPIGAIALQRTDVRPFTAWYRAHAYYGYGPRAYSYYGWR